MMNRIALLLTVVLCLSCFLVGCGSNGVDNTSIEKAVIHIEAKELENALKVCESMDEKTLEEGKEVILECILEKLK